VLQHFKPSLTLYFSFMTFKVARV